VLLPAGYRPPGTAAEADRDVPPAAHPRRRQPQQRSRCAAATAWELDGSSDFLLEERESGLVNGRYRQEQSGRLGLGQVALLAATSSFVGFWSN